jgi:ankyrin repeat protein
MMTYLEYLKQNYGLTETSAYSHNGSRGDRFIVEGQQDTPNQAGNTPLHRAAYHGDWRFATYLIDILKANVNPENHAKQTPLMMAIADFPMDAVKGTDDYKQVILILIKRGATIDDKSLLKLNEINDPAINQVLPAQKRGNNPVTALK